MWWCAATSDVDRIRVHAEAYRTRARTLFIRAGTSRRRTCFSSSRGLGFKSPRGARRCLRRNRSNGCHWKRSRPYGRVSPTVGVVIIIIIIIIVRNTFAARVPPTGTIDRCEKYVHNGTFGRLFKPHASDENASDRMFVCQRRCPLRTMMWCIVRHECRRQDLY